MLFSYRALKNNKVVVRQIEAESQSAVLKFLKSNDYFPIHIKKVSSFSLPFLDNFFQRLSSHDISNFTQQLAMMLNAGLTLTESLSIFKKQVTNPAMLKLITSLDEQIRGGSSFSNILGKYPHYFSNMYIALVKSGEASGKLSDMLLKLAENLEKQRVLKSKLRNSLIYPAFIVLAMAVTMAIMITFVIPKLLEVYKDLEVELPFSTKLLMVVSSFMTNYWVIVLGALVFLIVFVGKLLKTEKWRKRLDTLLIKLPIIGNVIKMTTLVDSTRTLSILISSGVSLIDSLNIISEITDNSVYQKSFTNVRKQVIKGVSLGNALNQEAIFPPILVEMTVVGEKTGQLDQTLMRISNYFEIESDLALKALTSMIEPLILVSLAIGVGFLVFAVITPIYNLTSSFQ
ncbi:type II secretion system F family protein [Candidatus Roizmanbacteria bacterium]|nr:type II secretion system F family protein [Candidatus Roizmanbacteria bacterium]